MAIIERSRGVNQPLSESEDPGSAMPVNTVEDLPNVVLIREYEIDALAVRVRVGSVVIARVSGPPWIAALQKVYPRLSSRHGPLCAPGAFGGPYHVVVLTDVVAGDEADVEVEAFQILDPWFPNGGQPLELPLDQFDTCYAGPAYACARSR